VCGTPSGIVLAYPALGAPSRAFSAVPAHPSDDALFSKHAHHRPRSTRLLYKQIGSKARELPEHSDYRTQPRKGQLWPSLVQPPKIRSHQRQVSCFLNSHSTNIGDLARKTLWSFGDRIASISKTRRWRKIRVCRQCSGSKRSFTQIEGEAHQPGVLLPSSEGFRRPVTGHQNIKAASRKRFLSSQISPIKGVTGKS
jgi:hypothetical protein